MHLFVLLIPLLLAASQKKRANLGKRRMLERR
jgi:hypothetical protein